MSGIELETLRNELAQVRGELAQLRADFEAAFRGFNLYRKETNALIEQLIEMDGKSFDRLAWLQDAVLKLSPPAPTDDQAR
ncbi:MAG TPA: hypothetical protein VMF32_18600 [Xanthobacteraceae bacterium]|nr:hypothetical protein [Xanthobacteraceae bacterium]